MRTLLWLYLVLTSFSCRSTDVVSQAFESDVSDWKVAACKQAFLGEDSHMTIVSLIEKYGGTLAAVEDSCESFMRMTSELEVVELIGLALVDVSVIGQFERLQRLNLSSNEIVDIRFIEQLPELLSLQVDRNRINSIDSVAVSRKLRWFSASENEITSVPDLYGSSLSYLNLESNRLRDVRIDGSVPVMERINLSRNYIEQFSLGGLPLRVDDLDLSFNRLETLGVEGRSLQVESLNASNNLLTSVRDLSGISGLRNFRVETNPVGESANQSDENCPSTQGLLVDHPLAVLHFCGNASMDWRPGSDPRDFDRFGKSRLTIGEPSFTHPPSSGMAAR